MTNPATQALTVSLLTVILTAVPTRPDAARTTSEPIDPMTAVAESNPSDRAIERAIVLINEGDYESAQVLLTHHGGRATDPLIVAQALESLHRARSSEHRKHSDLVSAARSNMMVRGFIDANVESNDLDLETLDALMEMHATLTREYTGLENLAREIAQSRLRDARELRDDAYDWFTPNDMQHVHAGLRKIAWVLDHSALLEQGVIDDALYMVHRFERLCSDDEWPTIMYAAGVTDAMATMTDTEMAR